MTETLRLDQIQAGQVVRLLSFTRCRRSGLRLAELGLTPGTNVRVLQASHGQPMLLRVRGSQLAIDRDTAGRIEVMPVGEVSDLRRSWWGRRGGRHKGMRWRRKRRGCVSDETKLERHVRGGCDES